MGGAFVEGCSVCEQFKALAPAASCSFAPLHPARLAHPLEGTLRREWERYISERPGFDILCGPEVHFLDVPSGVEADENKITGGHQPYPHGRMTKRDKLLAAELIQWLGSPLGFAFLSTAFERAGGRVIFDDYKHNAEAEQRP